MILRLPSYYKEFACIADRCQESCCLGWEIDIDEDTFDYYRNLEGPFGDRLRENMTRGSVHSFRLKKGSRCPFLNERNLCDIVLTLGETSLCEICTEYPRFTLDYADVRERCLSVSCEEVGRILFSRKEPTTFEETEIRETAEWDDEEEIPEAEDWDIEDPDEGEVLSPDDDGEMTCEVFCDFEDEEPCDDEEILAGPLQHARDRAIELLQDRTRPIESRICRYLRFCEKVQVKLNEEDPEGIEAVVSASQDETKVPDTAAGSLTDAGVSLTDDGGTLADAGGFLTDVGGTLADAGDSLTEGVGSVLEKKTRCNRENTSEAFDERSRILSGMEILDEHWRDAFAHMQEVFGGLEEEGRYQLTRNFMEFYRDREYEYEQLMVYFSFRYLMKSVFDYRFLSRAQLAVLSFLAVRDLDAVRFADQGGSFTLEDRIDDAKIWSREVEHSEDNLEYLAESFVYENCLSPEELSRQVLWGTV